MPVDIQDGSVSVGLAPSRAQMPRQGVSGANPSDGLLFGRQAVGEREGLSVAEPSAGLGAAVRADFVVHGIG